MDANRQMDSIIDHILSNSEAQVDLQILDTALSDHRATLIEILKTTI